MIKQQPRIIGINNENIEFLIPSGRNGYHNVIYNTTNNSWTCTCEHYNYRITYCKHMEQAKKLLQNITQQMQTTKQVENPYNGTIKNCAEI